MRTFVIGDIHGCLEQLDRLYKMLPIEEEDRLVFIGDYIDRGPDSRGVIDWILMLDHSWIALKGNHEEDMLNCLASEDPEDEMFEWLVDRGGDKTFASYGLSAYAGMDDSDLLEKFKAAVPPKHMEFYRRLKLIHEDENCICVHAGLDPLYPKERDPEMLLRIRNGFIKSNVNFGKPVVFGHTPQESGVPYQDKFKIGIDTGCFATGIMTAVMMPEKQFFQTERHGHLRVSRAAVPPPKSAVPAAVGEGASGKPSPLPAKPAADEPTRRDPTPARAAAAMKAVDEASRMSKSAPTPSGRIAAPPPAAAPKPAAPVPVSMKATDEPSTLKMADVTVGKPPKPMVTPKSPVREEPSQMRSAIPAKAPVRDEPSTIKTVVQPAKAAAPQRPAVDEPSTVKISGPVSRPSPAPVPPASPPSAAAKRAAAEEEPTKLRPAAQPVRTPIEQEPAKPRPVAPAVRPPVIAAAPDEPTRVKPMSAAAKRAAAEEEPTKLKPGVRPPPRPIDESSRMPPKPADK
jgi:serine/threonine protein phosphatase 1